MPENFPTYQDREGNQALNANIVAASAHGYSIAHGCHVELAQGDLATASSAPDTVAVTDGAVLVDGDHYSIDGRPTLTLQAADDHPRWDLIYVNRAGEVTVAQGDEEARAPPDATRTAVKRPAPPDLSDDPGTVLAMVWIHPSADFIGDDDIIERRTEGVHRLHRTLAAGFLQRQSLPAGETLAIPEDHVLSVSPPYELQGTLDLSDGGSIDLR